MRPRSIAAAQKSVNDLMARVNAAITYEITGELPGTYAILQGTLKAVDAPSFTITVQEKQKIEGKKRPVLVDVDKTYQMDEVKYAKYVLAFK